jgi:hypothetical protein
MYYTGINPLDMKKVYSPSDYREKLMQRALLQYKRPENRNLVREALKKAGREDLIGFDEKCLVKPDMRVPASDAKNGRRKVSGTSKAGKKVMRKDSNNRNKADKKTQRKNNRQK